MITKPDRIAIGVGFIILMANLNALIDAVIHPEIPYFDGEHLIVGGIGSVIVTFFLISIEMVFKRLELLNKELEIKVRERTSQLVESYEYLRESREHYRVIAESSQVGIWQIRPDGQTLFINPAMCRMLEIDDPGEMKSKPFESFVAPGSLATIKKEHSKHGMNISSRYEVEIIGKRGRRLNVIINGAPLVSKDNRMESIIGIFLDITDSKRAQEEMRKLEHRLHHARKMEAVGQLAAGIAHDFNNILSVIMGYGDIMMDGMKENDPLRKPTNNIIAASEKGRRLVKSLLAFSRKQVTNPAPVRLKRLLVDLNNLLTGLFDDSIRLNITHADDDLTVFIDKEQIEQAVINLATNARDAMPDGGTITIGTGSMEIDDEFKKIYGFGEKGRYSILSFTDTGEGMDTETKKNLFEPFFTTKEKGKGTGLGLAMVYGTVKQNNGYIYVYSDIGVGTTFKLLLPITETEAEEKEPLRYVAHEGEMGIILLVEDDGDDRQFTKQILEEAGYSVIGAVDADDAIEKFIKNKDDIDLLILDIILPGMTGKEVYNEITKTRPGIKALFTSGYAGDILKEKGVLDEGLHFMAKPFHPYTLLSEVGEVLKTKDRS